MSQANEGTTEVGMGDAAPQASSSAVTMDSPATAAQAAASLANVAASIGGVSHSSSSSSSMPMASMSSPASYAQVEAAAAASMGAALAASAAPAEEYVAKVSPDTMMAAAAAGTVHIVSHPEEPEQESMLQQDPNRLLADLQAAVKGMDPHSGLLTGTTHVADLQLTYLEQLSERFFDCYEHALQDGKDTSESTAAYRTLLTALEQVIQSVAALGLAGLPIDASAETEKKTEQLGETGNGDTAMSDGQADATSLGQDTTKKPLLANTIAASQDSFERRERMRESAGIVTSILGMAR